MANRVKGGVCRRPPEPTAKIAQQNQSEDRLAREVQTGEQSDFEDAKGRTQKTCIQKHLLYFVQSKLNVLNRFFLIR